MAERRIDFSKLFHQSSKDHLGGGTVYISQDNTVWPESWKTVIYKGYGDLPQITLPTPQHNGRALFDLVLERESVRDFIQGPISLLEMSALLKYSCGEIRGSQSRAQASGGARFPIETYVFVFQAGEGLPGGVYHYNVKEHSLDVLHKRDFSREDIQKLFTYPWVVDAAVAVVLTSVFYRMQEKYGERGYRYILFEAGHIGQNLYLTSGALGLGCCGGGGTHDEAIEKLLEVDGVSESVVYALAFGKKR